MITVLKPKKLQDGVPITNNTKILSWLCDKSVIDYKAGHKSLMADLRDELTKAFGRQYTTMNLEFRTKIWVLQYKDLVFNVYSAGTKGTTVEICDFSYEDMYKKKRQKDIIEFLELLSKSY